MCNKRQFEVQNGLRQRDAVSTLLFNLVIETVIRNSKINRYGTLINRSQQVLAYADDVLLARSEKELKNITETRQ